MVDPLKYYYYGSISNTYFTMKDAILSGNWGHLDISRPPGYPLFLAGLSLLGIKDPDFVRVSQALLDGLAILPLFYVIRSLTRSSLLALASVCIYAFGIWWVTGASYLLAESLLPALVIVVLASLVWVRGRPDNLWNWCFVGLVAVILPFFRPSMTLLIFPLVIWPMLVAPPKRRVQASIVVAAAFIVPLFAWTLRNYFATGHFLLTPSVKWYALWSGLGQLPNPFGYFTDDQRAQRLLSEFGIAWHSRDAELFFRHQYLLAWQKHPYYVLKTIWYRFGRIATRPDFSLNTYTWLGQTVYGWFALTVPFALAGLLLRRRWSDAALVAGPLVYALLTLGPMYVEPRYVRYAAVTYLLAPPVLVVLLVEAVGPRLNERGWPVTSNVNGFIGGAALSLLLVLGLTHFSSLRDQADKAAMTYILAQREHDKKGLSNLGRISLPRVIGETSLTDTPAGERLVSTDQIYKYLAAGPLPIAKPTWVQVTYVVNVRSGGVVIGILSAQNQWVAQGTVAAERQKTVADRLVAKVDPGAQLVVSGFNPDGKPVDVTIEQLDLDKICFKGPIHPVQLLFHRTELTGEPDMLCSSAPAS